MLQIALRHKPHAACIVPEKRAERTTEGGLDAVNGYEHLLPFMRELNRSNIRVSLFIEPDPKQLEAARSLGAPVVELHTGAIANGKGKRARRSSSAYASPPPMPRRSGSNATPDMV
jgi:pyridoxine 5-phosphate synthase